MSDFPSINPRKHVISILWISMCIKGKYEKKISYILICAIYIDFNCFRLQILRKSIKCYGNGNLGHTLKVYLTFMILFELQCHYGVRNDISNFYSY